MLTNKLRLSSANVQIYQPQFASCSQWRFASHLEWAKDNIKIMAIERAYYAALYFAAI